MQKEGEVDIGLYNLFKELGTVADISFPHAFYISALLFTIASVLSLDMFMRVPNLSISSSTDNS